MLGFVFIKRTKNGKKTIHTGPDIQSAGCAGCAERVVVDGVTVEVRGVVVSNEIRVGTMFVPSP